MGLWRCLQTALLNLAGNKLRSGLTMLSVIIGVSAVLMMVGVLYGATARITNEFNKLGSNLLIIAYAPDREEQKATARRIEGLKTDDLRAIEANCDLVKNFSPELRFGQESIARYLGAELEVTLFGVTPNYERLRNVRIAQGRFLTEQDGTNWSKVCVIGSEIARILFREENALGKQIEVNALTVTVVGVLEPKGRTFEGEPDKYFFMPLATLQKRVLGTDLLGTLYAEPADSEKMDEAKEQVWQLLMRRYDNLPGFKVDGLDSVIKSINQVTTLLLAVLGSIASLALLVGGIGIMNIMLVSVTERTREIGLRKAVGARRKDILLQFVIESATLSGLGGLIGVAIGTSAAYAIGFITSLIPALSDPGGNYKGLGIYVPIGFILGAFLYSTGIGIFFGIYPAFRASRLDPIQALRYE